MERTTVNITRKKATDAVKKALQKQKLVRDFLQGKITKVQLENYGIKLS